MICVTKHRLTTMIIAGAIALTTLAVAATRTRSGRGPPIRPRPRRPGDQGQTGHRDDHTGGCDAL